MQNLIADLTISFLFSETQNWSADFSHKFWHRVRPDQLVVQKFQILLQKRLEKSEKIWLSNRSKCSIGKILPVFYENLFNHQKIWMVRNLM